MELFIIIMLFIFGAIFGSFGSVLVWRLRGDVNKETVRGILIGNSHCPRCYKQLGALDLMPIFSYIFTNGKCRHCGSPISIFYPSLEILTGLIFVFSFWLTKQYVGFVDFGNINFLLNLFFICFGNWVLILFIMQDLLFFELNVYIWVMSLIILLAMQFYGVVGNFYISFWSILVLFGIFFGIYLFSKVYVKYRFGIEDAEGFGGGDVMVAFWLGMMFDIVFKVNHINFDLLNLFMISFYYLIISCFLGILFAGSSYIFFGGKQGKSIPFLPAMILGFWLILIFGRIVLDLTL